MNITKQHAKELINQAEGRIFRATFIKKNGEVRNMVCRLGVTKHLRGGQRAYNPSDYGLICVYDLQNEGYRSINLETMTELNIGGNHYKIR